MGSEMCIRDRISPDDQPPDDPGLIPLTVAEVKRLLILLTPARCGPMLHLHAGLMAKTPPSPRPLVPSTDTAPTQPTTA